MAAEVKEEIASEIGHVLFIDIVGYWKLLINEQSESYLRSRQKNTLEKAALSQ
jgi:hypothetical protein